jgi:hypothetical protein
VPSTCQYARASTLHLRSLPVKASLPPGSAEPRGSSRPGLHLCKAGVPPEAIVEPEGDDGLPRARTRRTTDVARTSDDDDCQRLGGASSRPTDQMANASRDATNEGDELTWIEMVPDRLPQRQDGTAHLWTRRGELAKAGVKGSSPLVSTRQRAASQDPTPPSLAQRCRQT